MALEFHKQTATKELGKLSSMGAIKEYVDAHSEFDRWLTELLESEAPRPLAAAAASRLVACPRAQMAARAKERAKGRSCTCAEFVKEQLAGGAGALHAILRKTVFDEPRPVDTPDGSLSLQVVDILKDEKEKWKNIWLRHGELPTPWRSADLAGDPGLPPLTAEVLRRAAKKFGFRKGHRGLSARWFEQLSEELPESFREPLGLTS